ncbi:GNAT family N-acetyltransferase [Cecembia lonarensis]|uniref:Acetyltransferase (GNAT) family protein n=1 Tax=Cecembia lonarensis (strain CCUG 58316 / KCTC 22772 / LW9) TaxID=1225176 RepID=K1KYB1_CECL9|nr:GNAT family N-acetyltransferase [Cecembia lonarensis]EKB49125.1 Acetyltransferase (GNAT) family protein [Cecembia lonarensis LW9]
MKPVLDIDFVDKVLADFFKKETLTNNYILREEYANLIESQALWYDQLGENIFFYVRKDGFFRLYYFINEPDIVYNLSYDEPIVLEILYRGEKYFPTIHQKYWSAASFKSHLTRDCYFLKNTALNVEDLGLSLEIKKGKSLEEIRYAKELIDSNLDRFTGDHLSMEEVATFAENGFLYLAYFDGNPCGILQADFKNAVFWLGHVVVDMNYRGKGVANSLVNYYLKEGSALGCKQFQLWVIQDNTPAVNLYKKFGFTYLNKSSYSMLKK